MTLQKKSFVLGASFVEAFRNALAKKHILLSNAHLSLRGNFFFLEPVIFFRYKRIKGYQKKRGKKNKNTFLKVFCSQLKFFKANQILVKTHNLTKKVSFNTALAFLKHFKRFKNVLFSRRFDLFSDFINLSSLFIKGLLSCAAYLILLKEIFSIILKKKHTQYFLFIHLLLKKLIKGSILGLKFSIAGRLKGKPRANTLKILAGKISCTAQKNHLQYSKIHAFTRYGVFGLKLWVNIRI